MIEVKVLLEEVLAKLDEGGNGGERKRIKDDYKTFNPVDLTV